MTRYKIIFDDGAGTAASSKTFDSATAAWLEVLRMCDLFPRLGVLRPTVIPVVDGDGDEIAGAAAADGDRGDSDTKV